MSTVIKAENLGKKFIISHEERERYTALRDVIARKTKRLFTRHSSPFTSHSSKEEFWALKDINFEVQQGDRIGIIGRNGAGKSTLLKILSRITEPTTGSVKIKGRVASLLEVGTGFHPELTGAENIYLNGAILGMSRAEVKKKFDEIVYFAEVEKFLDTPVKRYSSGMYVRLAFAVAAHLEPEILVVDEVLAVGDAEFQRKCLGKMEDVSKNEGRTVLFVSHNMAAVRSLCTNGLLLKHGRIDFVGDINKVISNYIGNTEAENEKGIIDFVQTGKKNKNIGILSAEIYCNNILTNEIFPNSDVKIIMNVRKLSNFLNPEFGIVIKDAEGKALLGLNNNHLGIKFRNIKGKEVKIIFNFKKIKIYGEGNYTVNLYFGDEDIPYECFYDAFTFKILDYDVYNSGRILDKNFNKFFDPEFDIYVKS